MELSELTTDESIAAQPHQVFLPGCFVVLQGISGDGLANTIETAPEYSYQASEDGEEEDEDDDMQEIQATTEEAKEAPPLEEDHFRPNLEQTSSDQPPFAASLPSAGSTSSTNANPSLLLSQLATNSTPTCALNNPVMNTGTTRAAAAPLRAVAEVQSEGSPPLPSPPEDSFVVINSDSDSPNTPTRIRSHGDSRRKQQAVLQWNQDRMQQQRLQRQEWQVQQQQHHPQAGSFMGQATTSQQQQDWWLDAEMGHLAVFDTLPHAALPHKRIVGTLAPGSSVTALRLYTLDSETLQMIHVDEEGTQTPIAPSIGVIQMLEVQLVGSLPNSTSTTTTTQQQNDPNLISEKPAVGYCVYSVHGYAFLVPGIATLYMNPQVWWWRVTCKVGAYLRQGLELSSDHQCTIPYGSFVQVTRKTVNRMGLSRLRVSATLEDGTQQNGWCSEFLNPLSGQRGHVVQPLPFVIPALYRVTLPEGAVIREDVELSSRQIGVAPCGTTLTIVQRRFSEHPQDQCVERLKLAGGRESGWISVRLNQPPPLDKCVVELVGAGPRFQPNQPGDFHWQILDEERVRQQEQAAMSQSRRSVMGDLSSIDEDNSSDEKPKARNSGSGKKKQHVEECMICLTEERNATIVHGETGHIACCLVCARILKARGDRCPVCRLEIDSVIQHFWA